MISVTIDGQFLFGAAALVIAGTGLLAQWRIGRKVEAVHDEVRPKNGLNAGDTLDAILSETIAAKPPASRTEANLEHQQHMADNDPSGVVAADQAAAARRESQ